MTDTGIDLNIDEIQKRMNDEGSNIDQKTLQ